MEVINEARRLKNEETLFNRWVVGYQTHMSFDEFKQNVGAPKSEQNEDETGEKILRKVKGILDGNF